MRDPAAWTNQWLMELPNRKLREMVTFARQKLLHEPKGIGRARLQRVIKEHERRKHEGGGGWLAEWTRKNKPTAPSNPSTAAGKK